MRPLVLIALAALSITVVACDRTTSVVAELSLAAGEPAVQALSARVFSPSGALGPAQAITDVTLPGRLVVLLPARDEEVRLVLSATLDGGGVAIGGARVNIRREAQAPLTIVLARATPDADGDGVPDSLDDCPSVADPDQANAAGGGLGDACRDRDLTIADGVDLRAADLAIPDMAPPRDLAPTLVMGTTNIGDHVDPSPAGVAAAYPVVATRSTTVRRMIVYVDPSSTAPTGTVGIYAARVDGGTGPGVLLASGTGPLTAGSWTEIAISPAVAVTGGAAYFLAMHNPNAATSFTFRNVCNGVMDEYVMWGPIPTLAPVWIDDSVYGCTGFSAYASE